VSLGQFLPLSIPLALLPTLVVAGVLWSIDRHTCAVYGVPVKPVLWQMLSVALVASRVAYVVTYFPLYRTDLLRIPDIRDGGFVIWAGVAAAAAVAITQSVRTRALGKPLALALFAGAATWGIASGSLSWFSPSTTSFPDATLTTLDGHASRLDAFAGQPIVVNLWATWCPPCQREMPVLAKAQADNPNVLFVFVNQGEDADTIRAFLAYRHLTIRNVLRDPQGTLGQEAGSGLLPTTLFYNADGREIDSRVGELSPATLEQRLRLLRTSSDPITRHGSTQ
jgi:thiol-disulfide isomerase/thioredoxin